MTEAEAISLLLKVAREWLTEYPFVASAERVKSAVDFMEAPVPNDVSGCMVCGSMPCLCPGGKPKFAPRPWMR